MFNAAMKLRPFGPDDWVADVLLRWPSGREQKRVMGVSHYVSEQRAESIVRTTVAPPRLTMLGRAPEILEITMRRRWQRDADMRRAEALEAAR